MAVYIINNGSGLLENLIKLLENYSPQIINRDDLANFKPSKTDLLILSGGHEFPVLWHQKEYADELRLVKKHKGPIIGICLGFEIITHAYGSHLHQSNHREHRIIEIHGTENSHIIPDRTIVSVFEAHIWSTLHIKRPLMPLAFSKEGIEIVKHSRKPIYGLQFHPEFRPDNNGKIIFDKIIDSIYPVSKKVK